MDSSSDTDSDYEVYKDTLDDSDDIYSDSDSDDNDEKNDFNNDNNKKRDTKEKKNGNQKSKFQLTKLRTNYLRECLESIHIILYTIYMNIIY